MNVNMLPAAHPCQPGHDCHKPKTSQISIRIQNTNPNVMVASLFVSKDVNVVTIAFLSELALIEFRVVVRGMDRPQHTSKEAIEVVVEIETACSSDLRLQRLTNLGQMRDITSCHCCLQL